MKRIRVVQFIGILLFIVYVVLIILELSKGFLGDLQHTVFSLVLSVISLNLLHKGRILKSSSTLWFALNLLLYALIIIILESLKLNWEKQFSLFVLVPIIPSVITLFAFNNFIYIKVIILNITIAIPFIIQFLFHLKWWIVIIIAFVSVSLGIIICRSINLDKEKING